MARPLDLSKHARRVELDFSLAHGIPFAVAARHFDADPRTVSLYCRRMIEQDLKYFARLICPGIPRDEASLFRLAAEYAAQRRNALRAAAEAAFHHLH